MKAVILVSSIFYILGLKISNKIDLIKKSTPVEKEIIQSVKKSTPEKTIEYNDALKEQEETETEKKECSDIKE